MNTRDFFQLFRYGMKDFFNNLSTVIPSVVLGLILFGVSSFGGRIAYRLQTTFFNVAWTVIAALLSFLAMGFIFSGLIGLNGKIVRDKGSIRDFFINGKKFWLRHVLIIMVIVAISFLLGRIAHYVAFFIGFFFDLPANAARLLFFSIYFFGLIGILIFLTFTSFFLVLCDLSVKESFRRSMKFVKNEYLATLCFNVIFFVVLSFLERAHQLIGDVIEYVLIVPFFALVLTRFVLWSEKGKRK